jgi:hypothetical protein
MPGAVRASLGVNASAADVERLCAAVARLAAGGPGPVSYVQDPGTGDFKPQLVIGAVAGDDEAARVVMLAGLSPVCAQLGRLHRALGDLALRQSIAYGYCHWRLTAPVT